MSQTVQSEYTIAMTEQAARVIREAFAAEGVDTQDGLIRVGAHPGGCSGYKYDMDFTESSAVQPTDRVFESQGIRIVVDATCLNEVLGSVEIDYQRGSMIESGFTFRQLTSGAQCGCGESFTPLKETRQA
jgi:iron-sulfur cluster assembly accessory protein